MPEGPQRHSAEAAVGGWSICSSSSFFARIMNHHEPRYDTPSHSWYMIAIDGTRGYLHGFVQGGRGAWSSGRCTSWRCRRWERCEACGWGGKVSGGADGISQTLQTGRATFQWRIHKPLLQHKDSDELAPELTEDTQELVEQGTQDTKEPDTWCLNVSTFIDGSGFADAFVSANR